jgi:hypothetical protein
MLMGQKLNVLQLSEQFGGGRHTMLANALCEHARRDRVLQRKQEIVASSGRNVGETREELRGELKQHTAVLKVPLLSGLFVSSSNERIAF